MSRRNSAREISAILRARGNHGDVKRGGENLLRGSGIIAVAGEDGEPKAPDADIDGVISDSAILVIRRIKESVLVADLIGDARI